MAKMRYMNRGIQELSTEKAGHERLAEAELSLQWLRGWARSEEIREELSSITKAVQEYSSVPKNSKTSTLQTFIEHMKNFRKRTFYRPFAIVLSCFFLSNMTGIPTLSTYAVGIFSALGTPIDKYYATIMMGGAQIVGSILCASIIHYSGKRPLAICSTIGQSILFGSVAFYSWFYAKVYQLDDGIAVAETFANDGNSLSWVPLVGLAGGALSAFMGARLLPWIIIGEIFPADIRALASGIGASMFYVFAFTANKSFFSLVEVITLPGVYWFYSVLSLLGAAVYYFYLPETEGWSLLEVQEHFAGVRDLMHAGRGGRKTDLKMVRDNEGFQMDERKLEK